MQHRFEAAKNFITPEDCALLNAWVDEGVEKKWLDSGSGKFGFGYTKRVTSRAYSDRYKYPNIVSEIADRIKMFCNLSEYSLVIGPGQDGVVVSCTFDGGDVYPHSDPRVTDNLAVLRCNVMTRAAERGGILNVCGEDKPLEVGELHCYLSSEYAHEVSQVSGATSRVLWMFGAQVPADDWNSGRIKFGPA